MFNFIKTILTPEDIMSTKANPTLVRLIMRTLREGSHEDRKYIYDSLVKGLKNHTCKYNRNNFGGEDLFMDAKSDAFKIFEKNYVKGSNMPKASVMKTLLNILKNKKFDFYRSKKKVEYKADFEYVNSSKTSLITNNFAEGNANAIEIIKNLPAFLAKLGVTNPTHVNVYLDKINGASYKDIAAAHKVSEGNARKICCEISTKMKGNRNRFFKFLDPYSNGSTYNYLL